MIKTHSVKGGNHRHTVYRGYRGFNTGNGDTAGGASMNSRGFYSEYSGDLTMTYGNDTDNPETRPKNYTVRIWKRIA